VYGCAAIWRLYQEAVQEKRGEASGRVYTWNAENTRGKRKSEYEVALEKYSASKYQDDETKPEEILEGQCKREVPRKLFRNIFADEMALRAALRYRVLKLSEVCLIKAYLASDDDLSDSKRWVAIGKRLGVSGKTVERRFRRLVEKLLKRRLLSSETNVAIREVHVRGDRQLQYYRRQSIQIGQWSREWWTLIIDKKLIRELRRQAPPMIRSKQIAVPLSPVNAMFAGVIDRLSNDSEREAVLPAGIDESDLEFNVTRAKRVLAGKKGPAGPWTRLEIAKKLVRGARLCGACRTFLIRGFRIHGSKITRAKEFCNKACQMRAERRKDRCLVASK
jgi:hypothetical protein